MKGQPGLPGMVPAGGVDEHHVGSLWERHDRGLQQRPLAQGEEARLVGRQGPSLDGRVHRPTPRADEARRRPGSLASSPEAGSGLEAYEAAGENDVVAWGDPRVRSERGQVPLDSHQLVRGVRPAAHPGLILHMARAGSPAWEETGASLTPELGELIGGKAPCGTILGMARLEGYRFGRVLVDGQEETRDVIVLPRRVIRNWWRKNGHALVLEDLGDVLDELPELLVVGTGAAGHMEPDPGTLKALRDRGVEVQVLRTEEAVSRYGAADPARTAAALHLTC
jgi:hypothetical protein